MIELGHQLNEPDELTRHRQANPGGSWGDPAFVAVRRTVKRQLNIEQEGLCVYCETELHEDQGHVEHIKSKGLNPTLTFVYDNLAHSCEGPNHCGHYKKRQILPVEPRPRCNRLFALMGTDGRIVAGQQVLPLPMQKARRSRCKFSDSTMRLFRGGAKGSSTQFGI